MNYWDGMLKKADLTMLHDYFLDQGVMPHGNTQTYEERIELPKDKLYTRLRSDYPNNKEYVEIDDLVIRTFCAYEEVFLEIGIKIGAKLQRQLLDTK